MAKSKYTYLLYDKNKNPLPVKPKEIQIFEFIKPMYPEADIDINDAIHLFNNMFSSNRELLDAIITRYNNNQSNVVKLNRDDFCYVKLVSKKFENIYGLPKIEDYSSKENYEDRENFLVPIIYKDDLVKEDKKVGISFIRPDEIYAFINPDKLQIYVYTPASDRDLNVTYGRFERVKEFLISLREYINKVELARKRKLGYDQKDEKGSIYYRTMVDAIILHQKIYDIYAKYCRKYVIGETKLAPIVFERLIVFSKSDLQNFKELYKDFPKERKNPEAMENLIQEIDEKRKEYMKQQEKEEKKITDEIRKKDKDSAEIASVIESEIKQVAYINEVNDKLGTSFTLGDTKDQSISDFIKDEHDIPSPVEPSEEDSELQNKESQDIQDVIKSEREKQDYINKLNAEYDTSFTLGDIDTPLVNDFVENYNPDDISRS